MKGKKKNINLDRVSIPEVRFKMKEKEFVEWCAKHGFIGDASSLWKKYPGNEKKKPSEVK